MRRGGRFAIRRYRGRLGHRLGFVPAAPAPGCLWVHAVSVGEVQAASSLITALRARHPELPVLLSTVTATGAQRARALMGDDVRHCYLPFDTPGAMRRFLDRVQPRLAVILETEIWPALYRELGRRGIPMVMASARLSQRSVDRFRRVGSLIRDALAQGVVIGAQTAIDAERFRAIGAPPDRVYVTGNVKLDLQIPQSSIDAGRAFRRQYAPARPVWIAGSTHEGEEEAALAAHAAACTRHPDSLLLLVPRHPAAFRGGADGAAKARREIHPAQLGRRARRARRGVPGRHSGRAAGVLRCGRRRLRWRDTGAGGRATTCSSRRCSVCR